MLVRVEEMVIESVTIVVKCLSQFVLGNSNFGLRFFSVLRLGGNK